VAGGGDGGVAKEAEVFAAAAGALEALDEVEGFGEVGALPLLVALMDRHQRRFTESVDDEIGRVAAAGVTASGRAHEGVFAETVAVGTGDPGGVLGEGSAVGGGGAFGGVGAARRKLAD
jgi:hypothetical protein